MGGMLLYPGNRNAAAVHFGVVSASIEHGRPLCLWRIGGVLASNSVLGSLRGAWSLLCSGGSSSSSRSPRDVASLPGRMCKSFESRPRRSNFDFRHRAGAEHRAPDLAPHS